MNRESRPTAKRIYRELTAEEQRRVERAREAAAGDREAILAEGRARKQAWEAMRRDVARTIAALKAERERLGLSLADVEARSGLKRSAISRLENDPNANPTLLTLYRYATALGVRLETHLEQA
ncbi:MAG: hypothetical protein KatS3mg111_3792 [Pirellulaceae bacterium]|nr:MAG: hypothetical protein KatS3mg111_3792 [Pirellulaceae bacterium]